VSRWQCRRCDWRPDRDDDTPPRDQLAEHAREADHPCCVVCASSLETHELQTCTECVAVVRKNLAAIVDRYAVLPRELGHATTSPMDPAGATESAETPLPGGDALAMLAPGSEGTQWRGRQATSRLTRTPWRPAQAVRNATEDQPTTPLETNDNLATDPPSVAFELSLWEDDWREFRREPAATTDPTVSGTVTYLSPNVGWASMYHPAFDEFAADVRKLLRKLQDVTGASERPVVGVPCLDCGARLVRQYGEEDYNCPRCRSRYDSKRYWLAVHEHLKAERQPPDEDDAEAS